MKITKRNQGKRNLSGSTISDESFTKNVTMKNHRLSKEKKDESPSLNF